MGVYRIRNSTPLLPRVLSQHSVVSIGVIADICVVIVVRVLIGFSEATCVHVGVGAHVNTTVVAEVTAIVTTLTMAVSSNTIIEASGGMATSRTFSSEDRGKSVGTGGGDTGDMGTGARGDSLIERTAVGVCDRDGEGGETVDTTMSPFSTTVAGTMEVGPNASLGQPGDGSGGIRWTGAGTKRQKIGRGG